MDPHRLAEDIRRWARELGFAGAGFARAPRPADLARLDAWLAAGRHGAMEWMARHRALRADPAALHPGTRTIISVRMHYTPPTAAPAQAVLADPRRGYISRYALGRDYHKVLRGRLRALARRIEAAAGRFGHRAFVDSAPVLEKPLAREAGLGWIGRHSNLVHPREGSLFVLGELYTDLELPADPPFARDHCGRCTACIDACPTGAIVAPYQVDARRCISYLTIELRGPIPEPLRRPLGNRIFGCDDCQLVCPWNRFARTAAVADFDPRHGLDAPALTALFAWDEATFLARTEGSALRRTGYEGWLRNVAVALGNAPPDPAVAAALRARADHPSALVREHVAWALREQARRRGAPPAG
ncbi:tRNA epoxyqueuosine(34) reductase QueG [Inmirania thermothiophila]|uniref:Epoxyqueuosine reductase n=1 Tax=Inmirania thermothiophila TaxID=1750597 RepID=A0A3N1XZK0_9GAMM|nr:tRNA epoxyqueuosine(34) reductase QueG [Inmirania thermothiophila]ROR32023.1 epoxyqueuosine reductase [Inmirania thermothiophila]